MAVLTFDDLGAAPADKKGPLTFDDLAAPPPPKGDEPSLLQRLFDVTNRTTGKSYIYGNTPAPQPVDDLMRTGADTATRGYLDKLQGPEAQAKTAAARERMPDWVEVPTDIATAVETSPYKIAGMGTGALFGGLEGAASAYGHQKDWVPDLQGAEDILKSAGLGVVAGAGGAKLGEKIGDWWSGRQAAKAQPYKTNAELEAAAARSTDPTLQARVDRIADVQAAQGSTRDEFANMMAGMQGATPAESAKVADIAGNKGFLEKAGTNPVTKAASFFGRGSGGGRAVDWLASIGTDAALHSLIPIPGVVTGTRLAATGLHALGSGDWAKRVPQSQLNELEAIIRDPSGRGISADPATVAKWRDAFSKMTAGYGRSQ